MPLGLPSGFWGLPFGLGFPLGLGLLVDLGVSGLGGLEPPGLAISESDAARPSFSSSHGVSRGQSHAASDLQRGQQHERAYDRLPAHGRWSGSRAHRISPGCTYLHLGIEADFLLFRIFSSFSKELSLKK